MFLFGPMIPRRIYFMAKQELFKIPVLNAILKSLGAYPVNRGHGDLQAAKTTLKLLEEGKIVGIFPEGRRRNVSKKKQKPKSGAILFSIEAGVPIIPVGIFGNYKIFSKIRVFYGKPYYPVPGNSKVSKNEMNALAQKLMDRIYSLDRSKEHVN
jgi:1-acyl-sn-glycerol-3-phosphate acyltransferase